MTQHPRRYVVAHKRRNAAVWGSTLACADHERLLSSHPLQEVVLLARARPEFKTDEAVAIMGEASAKLAASGKTIEHDTALKLRVETVRSLAASRPASIIIAFLADDQLMSVIDDRAWFEAIVAVPRSPKSIRAWERRWRPLLPSGERMAYYPDAVDPEVVAAIQYLSGEVNLANVILHRSDKELAKEVLAILRAKGHELASDQLLDVALQQGWRLKGAQQLAEMGQKFAMKKRVRLAGTLDAEALYRDWQDGMDV